VGEVNLKIAIVAFLDIVWALARTLCIQMVNSSATQSWLSLQYSSTRPMHILSYLKYQISPTTVT